ncbi:MAG: hypothetical protein HUK20_08055, partial [Fibrobacter sp.]|nr:hypothetical protein [Fibrobacter sp.]
KMFSATSIVFGNKDIKIPDTVGWFGTAQRDWIGGQNGGNKVGGPITIARNINFGMGPDTITTGPVHVLGDVTVREEVNFQSKDNDLNGDYCVGGSSPSFFEATVKKSYNGGSLYGLENCPESGVRVNTGLRIPVLTHSPTNWDRVIEANGATSGKEVAYINVPPYSEGDGIFDIYVDRISLSNKGRLEVRMPYGGRLTRVFMKTSLEMASNSKIQISYMDKDATFNYSDSTWNGSGTIVPNVDYTGNLLFYTNSDINFPAFAQKEVDGRVIGIDTLQGTFISTKTIRIGHHTVLAGQLLSDSLYVDTDFDGSGLIYRPFGPPKITIVKDAVDFEENNTAQTVPVHLDKVTHVNVSFKYCFEMFDGEDINDEKRANLKDFVENTMLHICEMDPATGTPKHDAATNGIAHVLAETDSLQTPIQVTPFTDNLREFRETVRMWAFEIVGAVADDNSLEHYYDFGVVDQKDLPPVANNGNIEINVKEDSLFTFDGPYEGGVTFGEYIQFYSELNFDPTNPVVEFGGIIITKLVDKGTLTFEGKPVKLNQSISADSLQYLVFTPEKDEFGIPYTDFKYMVYDVSLKDGHSNVSEETYTVTINVLPVNDPPVPGPATCNIANRYDQKTPSACNIPVTDVDDTTFTYKLDCSDPATAEACKYFEIDEETGAITVIGTPTLNEYTVALNVSDKSMTTGKEEDILTTQTTMVITIGNTNPVIDNPPFSVKENIKCTDKDGKQTVVGVVTSTDVDGDTVFTYEVVGESKYFDVDEHGVITVKCGVNIDYEKFTSDTIIVISYDEHGGQSVPTPIVINIEDVDLKITVAENDERRWDEENGLRDTIYTNRDTMNICWKVDNDEYCSDTTLIEGCVDYVKYLEEGDTTSNERDSILICYSSALPTVVVNGDWTKPIADNIFTIVEETDVKDTNIYVNKDTARISVQVRDNVLRRDTSFTIDVYLDQFVTIPANTYKVLESALGPVDYDNNRTTKSQLDDNTVKVTYSSKVGTTPIQISYLTDVKGNPIKVSIPGEKQKFQVATISTTVTVGGKDIVVSCVVDALTGVPLYTDANGALTTDAEKGGLYTVSYEQDSPIGKVFVTATLDEKGNVVKTEDGDVGFAVKYNYTNVYGNSGEGSAFVVVDKTCPKVAFIKPNDGDIVRSNSVDVMWGVVVGKDTIPISKFLGLDHDTLKTQGLEKGQNYIKRFYKDKAGNISVDSILVYMKDGKDVDISVERPVAQVDLDKLDEYYKDNPPVKGQSYAVSVRNPDTKKEVETLKGGKFGTKSGSGKTPYAVDASDDPNHLGPALILDIKVPMVNGLGGMATLDDLLSSDGMVPLKGIDAAGGEKITIAQYVSEKCEDGFTYEGIGKNANLYNTKLNVKIWIYTTLGNFIDYYTFTQDLNDPTLATDAGMLQLFFELKPDINGDVRDHKGRLIGTGSYLYKVEASLRSDLRCDLPPFDDKGAASKVRGKFFVKSKDDMLKTFGYKRPEKR